MLHEFGIRRQVTGNTLWSTWTHHGEGSCLCLLQRSPPEDNSVEAKLSNKYVLTYSSLAKLGLKLGSRQGLGRFLLVACTFLFFLPRRRAICASRISSLSQPTLGTFPLLTSVKWVGGSIKV